MLALWLFACADPDADQRPDLLMISIDTLRPAELGWFGGEAETPAIDALLGESLVLADHHSCSNWTYASVACAATGRSTVSLGVIPIQRGEITPLEGAHRQGAEALKAAGWSTTLVSSNVFLGPVTNTHLGFDEVLSLDEEPAEIVTGVALERWAAAPGPRFLHAHYIDPHEPYAPPGEFLGALDALAPLVGYDLGAPSGYEGLRRDWAGLDEGTRALAREHLLARYRGELAYVDEQVGRLLDEAALEGAAVALWTDHGEQIFERGDLGHSWTVHREENDALLAIRGPGVPAGVIEAPTVHQDLWPSVLPFLGVEGALGEGVAAWRAGADRALHLLRHRDDGARMALVRGEHKMMYGWYWEGEAEKRLYAADDPGESRDLYDPADPLVEELWGLMTPELERVLALYGDRSAPAPGP